MLDDRPLPRNDAYDTVVIGGGVNGTAAARELAQAGYSVALIEADDLASGASGRSSRMLHCGLRYFETPKPLMDFALHPRRFARALGMARESMRARAELAADDSVGTRAIELCFPIWRDGPFPRWQLAAGLRMLGLVAPPGPPLETRIMDKAQALDHAMSADLRDRDALTGMASFREYLFTDPERISIDAAVAARRNGADILLRTTAKLGRRDDDGNWLVALEGAGGGRVVTARTVLNLAGSWSDDVGDFGRRLIQGTKGAHIVVRLPERYRDRGLATMHRGGHPFYVLPMGDDLFYFGPTETPFEGDAREVRADADDIAFLLGEANHLLPGLCLTRADVVQTWAGVRPLTYDADRPMGARERTLHDLSRDGMPNVLAMTGGPVMSHRSAGRLLAQGVRERLGAPSGPPPASPPPMVVSRTPADDVIRAVTEEFAHDLYGVLVQRTGAIWHGLRPRSEVAETAACMASLLGWDDERTAAEIERFLRLQEARFGTGEGGAENGRSPSPFIDGHDAGGNPP